MKKSKYWDNMHPLNQAIEYKKWLKRNKMDTTIIDRRISNIASKINMKDLEYVAKTEEVNKT